MPIKKEQILQELDTLGEAELERVAQYLAFLKYQARIAATPAIDEQQLSALYAEFGEDDRHLAEEGIADYAHTLSAEDVR